MQLEAQKLLFDMQQAAEHIVAFAAGRTLDEYRRNVMLRSAVERQFQILGEALWKLESLDEALAHQITDWRPIISFRHILVHAYDKVRDETVWGVIEADLPVLLGEVKALLASPGSP